jgi:hypothetical protein
MAIPELRVLFCLLGHFDPDSLSSGIGVSADRTWRAGDLRIPNSIVKHDSAGWCIEAPKQNGWDLEPVVVQLLDRLKPARSEIRAVQQKFALRSQLSCIVYAADQVPSLAFGSDVIARLADLQASIDIDVMLSVHVGA